MTSAGAKYFVSADGKQLGPFTGQAIRTKLFRKTITVDDYVWRDGLGDGWVKISTILDELPSDAIPPPAPEPSELKHVNINHTDGSPRTVVEVPEKGVYEPPATLKQKNLLMKFGCNDPEAIRHLGREQASYIIDCVKKDFVRQRNKTQAIAVIVLFVIVLAVAVLFWFLSTYNQMH